VRGTLTEGAGVVTRGAGARSVGGPEQQHPSSFAVIDFPKLRALIESGSSGVVDVRADLHRALAELDWNAQRRLPVPIAPTEAVRWLTPEQASKVVPDVSVAQIYAWAKGQKWASRPSKRCLRINEAAFRNWLAARQEAV
jgi:hypothetical protein